MANESAMQHLVEAMQEARDLVRELRTYAIDLKALVQTGTVTVQNFPASVPVTGTFFQATQPISGTVNVGNFPNPVPVSVGNFPAPVVGTTAQVSLTATGNLVAAQGAGVAIRLLAAVVSVTTAVTLSLRNGAADVIPIQLATNPVVLPYIEGGWMTTSPNTALRIAFAGVNTVTAYALWTAVN